MFDYRNADVDQEIVTVLGHHQLAGTVAIGQGSLTHAVRIARRSAGTKRIASAYPDPLTWTWVLIARTSGIHVEPVIAGNGLQDLPDALDALRAGVSAAKIVVTIN